MIEVVVSLVQTPFASLIGFQLDRIETDISELLVAGDVDLKAGLATRFHSSY